MNMKKYKLTLTVLSLLMVVLLIACIALTVLLIVQGPDHSILAAEKNEAEYPTYELEATYDYGEGYLKSIIFICDKTLVPISDHEESISPEQIWTGIDGTLTLDRTLANASVITEGKPNGVSIPTAIENAAPQYVIITLGIENGVSHCTKEQFKEYYSNLINKIKSTSPDTRIILQSIFPVSSNAEKQDPSISNDRIDTANGYISSLAEELSVRYLNTSSVLKGEDGKLDPKYDSGNGIILNQDGMHAVAQYIRTHGYK